MVQRRAIFLSGGREMIDNPAQPPRNAKPSRRKCALRDDNRGVRERRSAGGAVGRDRYMHGEQVVHRDLLWLRVLEASTSSFGSSRRRRTRTPRWTPLECKPSRVLNGSDGPTGRRHSTRYWRPSISSRTASRCPAWVAVSTSTCTSTVRRSGK